jgi:hypothetical protein
MKGSSLFYNLARLMKQTNNMIYGVTSASLTHLQLIVHTYKLQCKRELADVTGSVEEIMKAPDIGISLVKLRMRTVI